VLPPLRLAVLLVLATAALRANPSLDNAWQAQARLPAGTWSRVLEVENVARGSRYPRVLHALVFELVGLLWFYTDSEGTQSFSLHPDNLAEEKADFAPLLHDIEPGFRRWVVLPAPPRDFRLAGGRLQNGCFIESVAALDRLLAQGVPLRAPRLLSFYGAPGPRQVRHTVLAYELGGALEIADPTLGVPNRVFSRRLGADPLPLAQALVGKQVVKARFLPLDAPAGSVSVATARPRGVPADREKGS
jgi:hypothetical protein